MKRADDREKLDEMRLGRCKRSAGYFMSGVLGCPPAIKMPPINSPSAMLLLLQKSDEMGRFLPCSGAPIPGRQRRSISI